MAPHSTLSRKKWNGVPVLAAKNSTLLPKMELLFIDRKEHPMASLAAKLLLSKNLFFTMTTQFEAKDIFFLTFVQQQNQPIIIIATQGDPEMAVKLVLRCYRWRAFEQE